MKILFFTTDFPPNLGGVAALSLEQAVHLAGLGHTVRVETRRFGELPLICQETPNLTVYAHRIEAKPIARLIPLARIAWQAAREFGPDLYYASTHRGFGLPMALLAKRGKRPYAIYVHGNEVLSELTSGFRRRVLCWMLDHAACLVANSRNTAENVLRANLGSHLPPIAVISPGIDQARLSQASAIERSRTLRKSLFKRYGLHSDSVLILSLCRLSCQKGLDRVFTVLSNLKREGSLSSSEFLYVLAGDGPDRPFLEDLACKLSLRENVAFMGGISYEETAVYLHAADIYVQPSQPSGFKIESFGISFLEAQFCGVPCIGTKFGGIPEAVIDGETGILVPVGDDKALMDALETLIRDPQRRRKMGEAGRKHAAGFSWERHAQQLSEFLQECCGQYRQR